MRIYKILFFSALVLLTACGGSEEEIPADVLQPERMAHVLTEVHIIDGVGYSLNQTPDSLYKNTMGAYVEVFKKYHTDTLAFKKSYTWYTQHPVLLDKIYDDVTVMMQAKNDSLMKSNKKKNAVPVK